MLEKRKQQLTAAALCLLTMSCGRGEPTAPVVPVVPEPTPTTGTLEVIVLTSGSDPDSDGYGLHVDTTLRVLPGAREAGVEPGAGMIDLIIPAVAAGTHTVALDRVANNCVLDAADPRSLVVTAAQKTVVTFTVTCLATGIEVSVHTTGSDHPPSYGLAVDGQFAGVVGADDSAAVTRLTPGTHVLTLGVRGDNCEVAVARQDTVTVANRSLVPVSFDVSCAPAVRGEKIAYAVDTLVDGVNGSWIVLINPDGTGAMPVVNGDHPAWSPDGTKLAYTKTVCEVYAQYYGGACGGGIEIIDPERWTSIAMPTGSSGLDPAWAPVGETVAFTRCCTPDERGRVYLAGTDGSTSDSSFAVSPTPVSEPSWSPDGQHLVVTCATPDGLGTNLCIVRKDSTGFRRLGVGTAGQSSPAWSPDGKRIAFTYAPGYPAKPEVMLMDVATLDVTALTDGYDPAWSPDGTKLVVVNADGLYVVNADGTHKTRITHGGPYAPAWRP